MKQVSKLMVALVWLGMLASYAHPALAKGASHLVARGVSSIAPLVETAGPAVVSIVNLGLAPDQNPLLNDPVLRQLVPGAGTERSLAVRGVGSGVIIDAKRGIVLTNQHVISNADKLLIKLNDERKLPARVLGADEPTDLAVLQVPAESLTGVAIGNSDALSVGDVVVAIGNPFGLGETVTSGVVSALGRSGLGIEGIEDFIQTDASINPGNSGGALLDMKGELVGINTAILAPGGGSVGIGFAIPINMAMSVVRQILAYGDVQRGQLGAQTQTLTEALAKYFQVEPSQGVVVTAVQDNSSADKAGLRRGDVISAIDGVPIKRGRDPANMLALMRVGQTVQLSIVRAGKPLSLAMTLSEPELRAVTLDPRVARLAGVALAEPPKNMPAEKSPGLLVIGVPSDSTAWESGLRPGDVIIEANLKTLESVKALVAAAGEVDGLLLTVVREGTAGFVLLQ